MLLINRLVTIVCFLLIAMPSVVFSSINDPTKPIFSETSSERVITAPVIKETKVALLQSIFYGVKNKTAVINGKIVKEGESTDDLLLKKIQQRHVILEYKKKTIKLYISKKIYIDKATGEISEE
jgi:hypothetical protein